MERARDVRWLENVGKADGTAWPTIGLAIVAFGGFVGVGYAAATGAVPYAVAVPLQALLAFASFTPMHDASHDAVSRVRGLNELVGWVCGIPVLAPFGGLRALHLAHHVHTNHPANDPDAWASKATSRAGVFARWWVLDLHYLHRYATDRRLWGSRRGLAVNVSAVAVLWATWTAMIATGHGVALLLCWLLPSRLAIFGLSVFFDWIPHAPRRTTREEDPYRASNVYEHRWLTAIALGQNYHLVHHLFPGVPFYRYGAVYWQIRDELLARGADVRQLGGARPGAARADDSLRVTAVIDETSDARTFVFEASPRHAARAGQFVTVDVPAADGFMRRCYSVSSARGPLQITVKRCGRASAWLHEHAVAGARLRVGRPAGQFVLADGATRPLALAAAGSGITPVIALAEEALETTARRVVLVYASRAAAQAIFRDRLESLARAHPARLQLVLHFDDADGGPIDAAAIARHLPGDAELYECGPAGFAAVVREAATRAGIPPARQRRERFTPRTATTGGGDGPRAASFVAIRRGARHAVAIASGETILAASRRAGLAPRASCEVGYCGTCAARLACGRVAPSSDGPLSDGDLARGFILPCAAHPLAGDPVVVDLDETPS